MESSIPMKLFPSPPSTALPPPRKSSLKYSARANTTELKGLALQVTARQDVNPMVQPANRHIKHSLFCDPAQTTPSSPSQVLPSRQSHTRRRSSRNSLSSDGTQPTSKSFAQGVDEDQLAPLPVNTHFGSISPPRRKPSSHLKRPALPWNISIENQPDAEMALKDDDQLSPLPEKTRFIPSSPKPPEYPMLLSSHSDSAPSVRSNSTKSRHDRPTADCGAPVRSMFPQYDHTKPLSEQEYYPKTAPAQPLHHSKISKVGTPVERPEMKRFDSKLGLVEGYELIPFADADDLVAMWHATRGKLSTPGRKVQLGLHQSRTRETSIGIGLSTKQPIYTLEKALVQSDTPDDLQTKNLAVEKINTTSGEVVPVIQFALPVDANTESKTETVEVADILPHEAIINAIEAVANSPAASAIATFDPTAASPQAARLAQDAVAEARRRYGCTIMRSTRKRDSLGAVTTNYILEHPLLGSFPVTVARKVTTQTRETKCKICLHHPTATSAAIAAESLVLTFLDFSRDACVVDIPGLHALDTPYMIDTAISTLLAIAAIENETVVKDTLTFAPPPKTAVKEASGRSKSKKTRVGMSAYEKRKWYRRSSRVIDKAEKALVGDPVDVPAVTRGAIALLGLSLKGAVFLLETGVRATASVVTHVAAGKQ